jgi:hypothetical protein
MLDTLTSIRSGLGGVPNHEIGNLNSNQLTHNVLLP